MWRKALVIITAPSGYGKTTLLRSFLQKQESALSVWVSWGQEVVDETWVWKRFCIILEETDKALAGKLNAIGLPKSAQETDYVKEIVRGHIHQPTYLIIDDFQECNSQNINRLITRLVYEEIPDFHIVIISRIYPDLPYEEMLLRGYCGAIDQTGFSLSRSETEEIFQINGVGLREDELTEIFEYTDGWISAVYLALYDYNRNGKIGTFTSASHLLKTAIFDKLSETMQHLYMKMSLFESFTLQAAVYIAESDILPIALTEAVETYGFMQYDSSMRKYQMHALLRTVAAGELERWKIDKKYLYNRGGEWYERSGEYGQAVINYRNAGNYNAIMQLLSGDERYTVLEAMPEAMNEIFLDMPVEYKTQYPTAWLSYIYSTIMRGDAEGGKRLYERTCCAYKKIKPDEDTMPELRGELLIIGSLLEFNDLEKVNILLKQAYELLGQQPSHIFRQTLLTYGVPFMTLLYYNKVGGLSRTIELEKEFARYHQRLVGIGEGGWDDLFDAEYALLTGNMEKADRLARQVQIKAVFRKQPCIVISGYYIQFKVMMYLGLWKELEDKMKEFREIMGSYLRKTVVVDADLVYSYTYACLGEKEKMADWLGNFNLDGCSRVVRNARSGCMAYGMLLCRTKQWMMLDSIADQILVPYEKTKHVYAILRGYIYKAIASWHLEGIEAARENMNKAVAMAEPDEVRLPFIENSVELLPIMEVMELKSSFFHSLKPLMKQYQKSFQLYSEKKKVVSLTQREKEILNLVKAGYRNDEISKAQNIALVTVEKNLTAIYRKLDVSNRTAAVAKWKEIQGEN